MDQNAINNERNMVMDFTRYNSLENTYRPKMPKMNLRETNTK